MNPIIRTAAIWGLVIGIANLIWLYLAFYLGLHTSGIIVFQVFMLVWLVMTVVGFILALRSIKRQNPKLSYWQGVGAGAVTAAVSAVVAVVAQVGYFQVVHPAWPEVMMQQTREYFTTQGLSPDKIEEQVLLAQSNFTLANYAVSSAAIALMLGIVLSAIIMIFLRNRSLQSA